MLKSQEVCLGRLDFVNLKVGGTELFVPQIHNISNGEAARESFAQFNFSGMDINPIYHDIAVGEISEPSLENISLIEDNYVSPYFCCLSERERRPS